MRVKRGESNIILVTVSKVFTLRRKEATVQPKVNIVSKVKTWLILLLLGILLSQRAYCDVVMVLKRSKKGVVDTLSSFDASLSVSQTSRRTLG